LSQVLRMKGYSCPAMTLGNAAAAKPGGHHCGVDVPM